jgi:hypothetical protein
VNGTCSNGSSREIPTRRNGTSNGVATRSPGERSRDDERSHWFREQKLKCYLAALDHLLAASELSASASPVQEGDERRYAREDELAIVRELRKGYRWTKSASAVCGRGVTEKLSKLSSDLYFTMQVVSYEGIRPGEMVRRPEGGVLEEWILSETIDKMCAQISEILRADLDSH